MEINGRFGTKGLPRGGLAIFEKGFMRRSALGPPKSWINVKNLKARLLRVKEKFQ